MPDESTIERTKEELREGKAPSTAAGEFVHEEIEHIRQGKHGARSTKQAIAIGLSKARSAGVPLKPPAKGKVKESTRKSAEYAYRKSQSGNSGKPSVRASRSHAEVLRKEPVPSASHKALSTHARMAARQRTKADRHEAAMEAAHTKGEAGLRVAAKKAARTRAKNT